MEGQRLGRYRLGRRLAAGGMAEVFAATVEGAEGFEKQVAVKRILPHLCEDPDFVEMFREEARLAARLSHANIAQVFDFDVIDGQYLLAMEWVHGRDLRRVLRAAERADSPPTPARAAHVAREVARALHHAHVALGADGRPLRLVHRDVSPQNILISFSGEVKLTDFGIAKAKSRSLSTGVGIIKGKSAYMSPEQARGDDLDARSDIFALGVVLWESLTGRRLFSGDSDAEILRAVQLRPAALPSTIRPGIPSDLDALVLRALAKERDERHASALELETELTDVLIRNAAGARELDLSVWMAEIFAEELEERDALLLEGVGLSGRPSFKGTARLQPGPVQAVGAKENFTPPPPAEGAGAGGRSPLAPSSDTSDLPAASPTPVFKRAAAGLLALGAAALLFAFVSPTLFSSSQEPIAETVPAGPAAALGDEPEAAPADVGGTPVEAPPAADSTDSPSSPVLEDSVDAPSPDTLSAAPRPSRARPARPATGSPSRRSAPPPDAPADPTPSPEAGNADAIAVQPPPVVEHAATEPSVPQNDSGAPEPGPRPAGGTTILAPSATPQESEARAPRGATIPAGTTLSAELSFGVETGRPAEVEARLIRSHVAEGRVLLPRGATLFGRARAEDERVRITFERLVLPSGAALFVEAFVRGEDGRPGLLAAEAMTTKERADLRVLTLPPGTSITVVLASRLTVE